MNSTQSEFTVSTKIKWVVIACLLFVTGLVVALFVTEKTPVGLKISNLQDLGGDFTLQSSAGNVSLSDFKGKVVIMYFGYMTCTAVCPTSMRVIARSINKLGRDKAKQVQALFVSIDPARDSVENLADYMRLFSDDFIAVTGSLDEVQGVGRQYGAYFEEPGLSYSEYLLEHVSRYYIIDRDGNLVDAMRHGSSANEIHARLEQLI